jgi:hypothetical protein
MLSRKSRSVRSLFECHIKRPLFLRFSHRTIHLKKTSDFAAYYAHASDLLTDSGGGASKSWNRHVSALLATHQAKAFFREVFQRDPLIAHLKQILLVALATAAASEDVDEETPLTVALLQEAARELEPDYDELSLAGLSVLDLALLAAAKVVHGLRDDEQFNFEQVSVF